MTTISKHCLLLQVIIVLLLQWMQASRAGHVDVYAPKGNITTPNYPRYVTSHDYFSTWTINVDSGKRIRLEIKDLILTYCARACNCDVLEIYDVIAQSSLAVLCSTISTPKVYYSSGRTVDVLFSLNYHGDAANRRFWIYYESYQSTTLSTVSITPTTTGHRTGVTTNRSSTGGKLNSVESTVLVVGIIVSVFLTVIIIFICGLRRRFSRRQQTPSLRAQQTVTLPANEEIAIPEPPPSYDEAMQSSRTSLTNLPSYSAPNSSLSLNNIHCLTDDVAPQNEDGPHASEPRAYDATGLPSYHESQRLSQTSLNRDDTVTV